MTTNTSRRRVGGSLVAALALGLLAAPGAQAAPAGVGDPRAVPTPGFAGTGVRTDACDDTTAPGWIGTATPGLTVTAASPRARFAVWDETAAPEGDKVIDTTVDTGADGTARLTVPALADGRTYAWRAWPERDPGQGAPTPKCHVRVDTTRPAVSVASTDFPASGSGATPVKYAGETGAFTVTGLDAAPAGGAASGVACFRYVLNGTLGVGWDCATPGNTAKAAADGSAVLQLKPHDWGINMLTVQAMDQAGNVGQPFTHTFYAPWDPRPKPIVPSDVDADGVPDILLPDAAGNLAIISAAGEGTTPSAVVHASLSPLRAGWQHAKVLYRGWAPAHGPGADLLVQSTANPRILYGHLNHTGGDFSSELPQLVWKPAASDCVDAAGEWGDCPSGYTADWASAEQLVALGSASADPAEPSWPVLVSVEQGRLWAYHPSFTSYYAAQAIATTGDWSGYELVAPGPDAAGNLTLWSRERATGVLRAYPVPKQENGLLDFSALADPAAGTVVANGLTPAAYPVLGSSGDADGDGAPDLWAVTADRHLVTFTGWSAPKDRGQLG
ncbi:hypothetical protein ACWGB8_30815 [Kitasatospora sp. NPDC054939]